MKLLLLLVLLVGSSLSSPINSEPKPEIEPPPTSKPEIEPPPTSKPEIEPPPTSKPEIEPLTSPKPEIEPFYLHTNNNNNNNRGFGNNYQCYSGNNWCQDWPGHPDYTGAPF